MWRIGIWLVLLACVCLGQVWAKESSTPFTPPAVPTNWWGLSPDAVAALHVENFPDYAELIDPPVEPGTQIYLWRRPSGLSQVAYYYRLDELSAISFGWNGKRAEMEEIARGLEEAWRSSRDAQADAMTAAARDDDSPQDAHYILDGTTLTVTCRRLGSGEEWNTYVYATPEVKLVDHLNRVSDADTAQIYPDKLWPCPGPDFVPGDPKRYQQLRKQFVEELTDSPSITILHPKEVGFREFRPYIQLTSEGMYLRVKLSASFPSSSRFLRVRLQPSGGEIIWQLPVGMLTSEYHPGREGSEGFIMSNGVKIPYSTAGTSESYEESYDLPVQSGADKPGIDLGDLMRLSQYLEGMELSYEGATEFRHHTDKWDFAPLHDTLELFQLMGGELPFPLQPRTKPPKTEQEGKD